MLFRQIFVSLLILVNSLVFSQNYIDIVKIKHEFVPENGYDNSDETTSIHDFTFGLTYPIVINSKNALITGIDYSVLSLRLSDVQSESQLHSTGLQIGLSRKHSNKLSGTYIFIPKAAGDYGAINKNDFQYGGILLWKYKVNNQFLYKFGAYGSTETFGFFTTPIIGLYYLSKSKKLEMNLTLPIVADINYKFQSNLRMGMDFLAIVRSYNLTQPIFQDLYVHRKAKEIGGYLQLDLWKEQLIIKAKMVYTMHDFQTYETGDNMGLGLSAFEFNNHRIRKNEAFKNALGFKIGLIYRFHIPEESKED